MNASSFFGCLVLHTVATSALSIYRLEEQSSQRAQRASTAHTLTESHRLASSLAFVERGVRTAEEEAVGRGASRARA